MAIVKLTAKNQTAMMLDDSRRMRAADYKVRAHYSIGDHLLLLSKRLDALEAKAIEARSVETGTGSTEGESAAPHGVCPQ